MMHPDDHNPERFSHDNAERINVLHNIGLDARRLDAGIIESMSKTYAIMTNFSIPTKENREKAANGDTYHRQKLILDTNRVLKYAEMMRRGFGIIPGDEKVATHRNGNLDLSMLAFYRNEEVDENLLWKFDNVTADMAPKSLDVTRRMYEPISSEEISNLFDYVLSDEQFTPLLNHYLAHMERQRNPGQTETAA